MIVVSGGRRMYLWRAVDSEGEVLDLLVQRRRDTAAAVKVVRHLMKKQGFAPRVLVTDKLRSYSSAKERIGPSAIHEQGLRTDNRAGDSHQPVRRRERKLHRETWPHQRRSRHSSKRTLACTSFGSPVSITGRMSSGVWISGSRA